MRRRSAIVFGVLALLAFHAAAQTAPVRVTSTMGGTLRRGQTATVTWTVTGTTEPIRLRLRNVSLDVGTLEGGDVQFVETSGGSPNTVSRSVTGVSPGQLSIQVDIDPGANASAEEIATMFRRELPRIASSIQESANALPMERTGFLQRRTVLLDDALDLLDRAEADLRSALPYRELMPFQDAVTERMENARHELTGIATAEILVPDAPVLLARTRSEARVNEREARSILSTIVEWLNRLGGITPITRVCFRMASPGGAGIWLHAASVPGDRKFAGFVSSLDLYLGRWVFEVKRPAGSPLTNGVLDLTSGSGRVLHCPGQAGVPCILTEESTETCR